MTDFLIYTGLNLAIFPEINFKDKKKGSPYYYGSIVNLLGVLSYDYLFKNKVISEKLPHPEYFYKVSFQVFFDSLLFKNNTPVLIDGLMVLTSIASRNILLSRKKNVTEAFYEEKKDL